MISSADLFRRFGRHRSEQELEVGDFIFTGDVDALITDAPFIKGELLRLHKPVTQTAVISAELIYTVITTFIGEEPFGFHADDIWGSTCAEVAAFPMSDVMRT